MGEKVVPVKVDAIPVLNEYDKSEQKRTHEQYGNPKSEVY